MNPEESPKKISSERFFGSSRSRFGFAPRRLRVGKIRTISGIVPKRSIPDELTTKISSPSLFDDEVVQGRAATSSLGRLTLDLVQISDNLDTIKQVIAEDYNQTKETNRKEIEDYRKRIANRGKKLPKKDLGDDKSSLKDIIKPFVGGFFSGVGGAIRSLAAFNLIEAFLNGDYTKVFKSLMGIGLTFIPQIGAMIAGSILKSLLKGFGKRMIGGGGRGLTSGASMGARGPGLGKFGSMMALGAGALALGGAYLASKESQESATDSTQTRLEELTVEQKSLTDKNLIGITQQDLKKFQDLNQKFERTLDVLLGKVSPTTVTPGVAGGGGGSAAGAEISNAPVNMDTGMRGSVPGQQFNNEQLVALAKRVGATDEEAVRLAAIAKYESGGKSGELNDNPRTGDLSYGLWQINMIGSLGEPRRREFGISSNEQLFDPVTNAQAALKVLRSSGWGAWTTNYKVTPADLQQGRSSLKKSAASTPQARPAPPRRSGDEVSAAPSSSGRSIAVLPIPQLSGSDGGGSFVNNGSESLASVDPTNNFDIYGKLYRTGWNVVDVG